MYTFEVLAALAPSTRYEILRSTNSSPLEPITSFTTAAGPDGVAPGALAVADFAIAHAPLIRPNTCQRTDGIYVSGSIAGHGGAAYLALRATRGDEIQELVLFPNERPFDAIKHESCSPSLDVIGGEQYAIEIWNVDLAGNAGPRTSLDVEVRNCAPVDAMEALFDCPLVEPLAPPADSGGCAVRGGDLGATLLMSVALLVLRRRRPRS
ncbi:MAG: hypothetical protein M3619_32000 [Myxococcota bacterium]|nr:hypothetical protein [Myxococcota bacterium]